ncbi:hypothetical protein CMUS01_01241 [Colletotrichum musicola]|uniref:Uncharacterized protein n=1 Tax=Colletotrichum musicola TaxID=2175873 RepID=A0A8H6NX63_9PEZI|nr:hypothetical protein CMUS01_01241 [Colletotrichum musicola]
MRRGGIEPPAPRRCWMATENFTTKPSALMVIDVMTWNDCGPRMLRSGEVDTFRVIVVGSGLGLLYELCVSSRTFRFDLRLAQRRYGILHLGC